MTNEELIEELLEHDLDLEVVTCQNGFYVPALEVRGRLSLRGEDQVVIE